METPPVAEESPPTVSPDRRKWATIAFVLVIAGIAAAALLPPLLTTTPAGQANPISGTIPQATITPPFNRTPGPTLPVSPVATSSPTPSGPPGFTVTIVPTEASGARGETVVYHMTIEAQNGFSENISMQLEATALFVIKKTVDLGVQQPPYPKTIDYPFFIPADWPPGITIDGVVRSTGGGITSEDRLSLTVR
jgi:hypothetical protein